MKAGLLAIARPSADDIRGLNVMLTFNTSAKRLLSFRSESIRRKSERPKRTIV